eukprot:6241515-Prymnesium_polylepis.1
MGCVPSTPLCPLQPLQPAQSWARPLIWQEIAPEAPAPAAATGKLGPALASAIAKTPRPPAQTPAEKHALK